MTVECRSVADPLDGVKFDQMNELMQIIFAHDGYSSDDDTNPMIKIIVRIFGLVVADRDQLKWIL